MPEPTDTNDDLRSLPKVLLHEHLDGGLRLSTLMELLQARGIATPSDSLPGLAAWFNDRAHAGSLVEYLRGFDLTVSAMATPEAMERVAFEAVEDAARDGCVLAEFRMAPELFEPHGIAAAAATEALLAGLQRGSEATGMPSGLIVCAMRHHSEADVSRNGELALTYRGQGVVGFDLAGPEAGFPAIRHAHTLSRLRKAGIPLTLHAGEADGAERVVEAIELGARRIGHGVRLADAIGVPGREQMVDRVRESGVHLEVCPTSNVHTGAATSVAAHPIRQLWEAGVSLSYHTDNRLISCVSLLDEAVNLVREAAFRPVDLLRMAQGAARSSFLPEAAKAGALKTIGDWAAARSLTLG